MSRRAGSSVKTLRSATFLIACLIVGAACTTPIAEPTSSPRASDSVRGTSSPIPSSVSVPSASASPAAGRTVLTAVRFVDATRGWLGVEDGILGTTDGGSTWARQLRSAWVDRIWALDAQHLWARAADGTIYRTGDGARWDAVAATVPPIAELQFITPLVGWAIAVPPPPSPVGRPTPIPGTLLSSTDGGITWRPVTTRSIRSVCFTDDRNGWGADGKQILRTSDGGQSWALVADFVITDDGPWYPTVACADRTSAWVQITEPYAALSHVPYLVYRTSDAGRSWTLAYREPYTLSDTTPAGVAALGSYPSEFGVLRGGEAWFLTCTPPADRQRFLLHDPAGRVVREEAVPATACAQSASFLDAQRGWIVRREYELVGTQLRTTTRLMATSDGALTWSAVFPR